METDNPNFDITNGQIKEFAPNIRSTGMAFDSLGNSYVVFYSGSQTITKITPDGTVTTNWYNVGSTHVNSIVINSKDEMFVTGFGNNALYKIVLNNGEIVSPNYSSYICC